jgi:hypothetical protein
MLAAAPAKDHPHWLAGSLLEVFLLSNALNIMAWSEILARTMQGFAVEIDASPAWLVNPATKRRLKLDQFYPEAGLAVRFVGLTAKGQPKQSDWEQLEDQQRDLTREELCRQHGVELFLVEPDYPYPSEQIQRLRSLLSRLERVLPQGSRPGQGQKTLAQRLAEARGRLDEIARRVKSPETLALYAELWRDRETATLVAARPPASSAVAARPAGLLRQEPGARVAHTRFGLGVIETVDGAAGDAQITVLFDSGEQRTFLASLVGDKLQTL